ncbi:hypothetical protein [Streptomyces mirabilis]|uniref:hypothetical protein n=1 Tax=Streptomyces mirabilis TaxID=68239 RepID=UPI003678F7BF
MRRIALFITCFNDTIPLVERFSRTFAEYDAVVTPSASCAGMVREAHPLPAEDSMREVRRQVVELMP